MKFEYKIERDLYEDELNKLGEEGWELMSVAESTYEYKSDFRNIRKETGHSTKFIFKRLKP